MYFSDKRCPHVLGLARTFHHCLIFYPLRFIILLLSWNVSWPTLDVLLMLGNRLQPFVALDQLRIVRVGQREGILADVLARPWEGIGVTRWCLSEASPQHSFLSPLPRCRNCLGGRAPILRSSFDSCPYGLSWRRWWRCGRLFRWRTKSSDLCLQQAPLLSCPRKLGLEVLLLLVKKLPPSDDLFLNQRQPFAPLCPSHCKLQRTATISGWACHICSELHQCYNGVVLALRSRKVKSRLPAHVELIYVGSMLQ
mmetsp:Transcript_50195/g.94020  ORF Transcript_50195/g.94020 Transcript_50195/m.94020 type:complete len:253 (+) Transcript_50195:1209-1967(+)